MADLNESLRNLVSICQQLLLKKDEENKALLEIIASKKCNDYTFSPPQNEKKGSTSTTGRSGWRSKAQIRTLASVPPIPDSVLMLEAKVEKERVK